MKSLKFLIGLLGITLLSLQSVEAQTYSEENTDNEEIAATAPNSGIRFTQISLLDIGIGSGTNPVNQTLSGNSVLLNQLGSNNIAGIFTETQASDVTVNQNGNQNTVDLAYRTKTAFVDVEQNGNRNNITDLINRPDLDVSLELQQNGDGLNFQRFGANDLTKSLKFRQSESTRSIIVRSMN